MSPSPVLAYDQEPPAGVPLFYVQDPRHDGWYVGIDWNGQPRGTVKLATPLAEHNNLVQAPDGSGFGYIAAGKGGLDVFLDRLGRPIASQDSLRYNDSMWADDSHHLCTLDYMRGSQFDIGLRTPETGPTEHPVAIDPANVSGGIIALGFRNCSAANDRAVLAYKYMDRPTEVYVVRISTGAISLYQKFPANTLADITASPDGSLIAKSSGKSVGYIGGPTADTTVVESVSDGRRLTEVDPAIAVLAISGDDRTALVTTSPSQPAMGVHLALLDIQTGQLLWTYKGKQDLLGWYGEPGGPGFALLFGYQTGLHAEVTVTVVAGDGKATAVPGTYLRP